MALLTLADIQAAPSQKVRVMEMGGVTYVGGGGLHSFWLHTKLPGNGTPAAPAAAGSNPDNTTAGAIPFRAAGGGLEQRIVGCRVFPEKDIEGGYLMIYDRLWHSGGHSGTDTSLISFTSAITRGDTTGEGVLLAHEVYAVTGVNSITLTATYTNQAGTGSRVSTYACNIYTQGYRSGILMPLQGNDTGVRSLESVQLSGSMGGAGNYGMTLMRPLICVPVHWAGYGRIDRDQLISDLFQTGFPKIDTGACLAYMLFTSREGDIAGGTSPFGFELDIREG